MKYFTIIIVLIIVYSTNCEAQSSDKLKHEIDSLILLKNSLEETIKPVLSRIDSVKSSIKLLETKLKQVNYEEILTNGVVARTNMIAKLYEKPDLSDVILKIPDNTEIVVFSKHKYYYKVLYNGVYGFVHEISIKNESALNTVPVEESSSYNEKSASSINSSSTYSPKNRSSTSTKCNTVQCSGRTQKGSRCRNKTTNCSGRCHVH